MGSSEFSPASYKEALRYLEMSDSEMGNVYRDVLDLVHYLDQSYYKHSEKKIPDSVYDLLKKKMISVEEAYPHLQSATSPTISLPDVISNAFSKAKHPTPMISIRTVLHKEPNPIEDFVERVTKRLGHSDFTVEEELKFDGAGLKLIYSKGKLTLALTRGDGYTGEVVTENALAIKNIPHNLFAAGIETLEVAGEVVMETAAFEDVNAALIANGKPPLKNKRNAASGSLRQLSSQVTAARNLRFIAYHICELVVDPERIRKPMTQKDSIQLLKELGFDTFYENDDVRRFEATDYKGMYACFKNIQKARQKLSFDIDGVVFKVSEIPLQKTLGVTGREPNWSMAYKFPPEEVLGIIKDIVCQVGMHGSLTPVAVLEPVEVGGVTVTRANLHNQDEITRLDIRIGDYVKLVRAGDVIPDIQGVELALRPDGTTPYYIDERYPKCPSCGGQVANTGARNEKLGTSFECLDHQTCPAQLEQKLAHFFSRKGVNVDGIGAVFCHKLVENGYSSPAAVFRVSEERMLELELASPAIIRKVFNQLHRKSFEVPFNKLLVGLAIPGVSEGTAKRISNTMTFDQFRTTVAYEELLAIKDIGEETAESLECWLVHGKELLDDLSFYINVVDVLQKKGKLTGVSLCITGSFHITREIVTKTIEDEGGEVTKNVSKKTKYLLVGENPSDGKVKKAQKLGVEVIDPFALEAIIDIINLFNPKE